MIEKILEAYEAKTAGNNSFWDKLKRMDLLTKILFWGGLVCGIVIFGIAIFAPSGRILIMMIAYVIILCVSTIIVENLRHRKWKTNILKYNADLDIIAEILKEKEFELYEKNKIKQLIRKFYQSIDQHTRQTDKKKSDAKEFIYTYIIPIVAFFVGKINTSSSTNNEWIAIGIVIIIIVVSGKYMCSAISEIVGMISWNQLEKEKYFVLKLQDLLDRDFVIEQEDLIELK